MTEKNAELPQTSVAIAGLSDALARLNSAIGSKKDELARKEKRYGAELKDSEARLELLKDPETMSVLKAYLEETMAPGTQVQLWQVATNRSRSRRPCLYRGKLSELSGDTFRLLFGSEELCIQIEY